MSDTAVQERVKTRIVVAPPTKCSVVFVNDNVTTVSFVVQSLCEVFHYSLPAAYQFAQTVDTTGEGVAATGLSREIAEHLRDLVVIRARAGNWPLVEVREE